MLITEKKEVLFVALSSKKELQKSLQTLMQQLPHAVLHIGKADAEMVTGNFRAEIESDDPQEVVSDKLSRAEQFFLQLLGLQLATEGYPFSSESSLTQWLKEIIANSESSYEQLAEILFVAHENPSSIATSIEQIHAEIVRILKTTVMYTSDVVFAAENEFHQLETKHRLDRDKTDPDKKVSSVEKFKQLEAIYRPGQLIQWQVALGSSKFVRNQTDENENDQKFTRKNSPTYIIEARLPDSLNQTELILTLLDYYNAKANTRVSMVEYLTDNKIPFSVTAGDRTITNANPALIKSLIVDKAPPTAEILDYFVN